VIPYPNRTQWVILWLSVLVAAHVWLPGNLSAFWTLPSYDSAWGLPLYLSDVSSYAGEGGGRRLAFIILVIGALLAWQASRWRLWPAAKK
jgi:hypothetical protein